MSRSTSVAVVVAACAGLAAGQARERADDSPLGETERIRHVLSRFAFGPTPGLVASVRQTGLDAWFEGQLAAPAKDGGALDQALGRLETIDLPLPDLVARYDPPDPGPTASPEARADYNRRRSLPPRELKEAILRRAVAAEHQLREVAADFWRNHFNVSVNKDSCRLFATDYEREVIRRHALGQFGAMLEASAKHPAMLVYLDNALSRRPPSKQELREIERNVRRSTGSRERASESVEIARQRGLNENYARELLELHTLGVDNGYTQKDVIAVAEALTGWTVQTDAKQGIGFVFRGDMHVPGEKVVLGLEVRPDRKNPLLEGEIILRRLVRHPGTAQFLAWKLCRYFVDDAPPEAMVKRVAAEFRRTQGDLRAVYRAIYKDPEFWAPRRFQAKFKRPFEFVVSAVRVTGASITDTAGLVEALRQLQEPLYEQEDPTGYYDQAEAWNDPGVMAGRWKLALDLATGKLAGVQVPAELFAELRPDMPRVWKDQLARKILPAGMSDKTSRAIDRLVTDWLEKRSKAAASELKAQVLGLLLGSPEFQRQ